MLKFLANKSIAIDDKIYYSRNEMSRLLILLKDKYLLIYSFSYVVNLIHAKIILSTCSLSDE